MAAVVVPKPTPSPSPPVAPNDVPNPLDVVVGAPKPDVPKAVPRVVAGLAPKPVKPVVLLEAAGKVKAIVSGATLHAAMYETSVRTVSNSQYVATSLLLLYCVFCHFSVF